jgi:hypothetical protein
MAMKLPPIITEEMRIYFKACYDSKNKEDSLQNIMFGLKNQGFSQMQSLYLLIEQLEISFAEANRLILNSTAWSS